MSPYDYKTITCAVTVSFISHRTFHIFKPVFYNQIVSATILGTKLHIPLPRANIVRRSRLIEQLNQRLHRKLTLISAPAGFGKREEPPIAGQPLIEPLSKRELEVLQLIAQGLSNQEISKQLFLALDTVKGHNRKIFDKLGVQRRTEAVARARDLGLL